MELSQLEVFLAVAREHRFSRAAEKLYRTQSAVSQTIRKLEDELGAPLFERTSRGARLTDAGEALLPRARDVLEINATLRYYLRPRTHADAHGYGQLSRFLSPAVLTHMDQQHDLSAGAPSSGEAAVRGVDDLLTALLG